MRRRMICWVARKKVKAGEVMEWVMRYVGEEKRGSLSSSCPYGAGLGVVKVEGVSVPSSGRASPARPAMRALVSRRDTQEAMR